MYPKKLSDEQIEEMVEGIISDWLTLKKQKELHKRKYINYENNKNNSEAYQETIYNIIDKTVKGETNNVSEDLRDYLRRRGIKIYAERKFGFKSI